MTSRIAFIAAFLFAMAASAGLISQRLTRGESPLGWLLGAAMTLGAVVMASSTHASVSGGPVPLARRRSTAIAVAQVLGTLSAVGLTHLVILLALRSWGLVERPAQLVNDGMLTVPILCLTWSFASPNASIRRTMPLVSFALLGAYALTEMRWHLDPFPGLPVQRYVVAQVLATAAVLLGRDILASVDRT